MKKENFEQSLKWGGRAFKEMAEGIPKLLARTLRSRLFRSNRATAADRSIPCKFSREAIAARRSVDLIFDWR
jgi:hypothetical protein